MSAENYMRIIDLRGKTLTRAEMLAAMPRAEMGTDEATELVQPILDNVKRNGAKALRESGVNALDVAEAMEGLSYGLDEVRRDAVEVRRQTAELTGMSVVFGE